MTRHGDTPIFDLDGDDEYPVYEQTLAELEREDCFPDFEALAGDYLSTVDNIS